MLEKKIGFIGYGNIAQAMIKGFLKKENIISDNIFIYDHKIEKKQNFEVKQGVTATKNVDILLKKVDILFFTVKPNTFLKLLEKINDKIQKNTIIISVVAGITFQLIENIIGTNHKIIRAMPNIATLVNESMTAIAINNKISFEETKEIIKLFDEIGKTKIVDENLMHTTIGISGSAVVYIFILIEAMSDAAVLSGMSRDQAYYFACQTVKGASQIMLETKIHPGKLKDMVCSPKGTSIELLRTLEEKKFRSAIIESMINSINKSKKISKNYKS